MMLLFSPLFFSLLFFVLLGYIFIANIKNKKITSAELELFKEKLQVDLCTKISGLLILPALYLITAILIFIVWSGVLGFGYYSTQHLILLLAMFLNMCLITPTLIAAYNFFRKTKYTPLTMIINYLFIIILNICYMFIFSLDLSLVIMSSSVISINIIWIIYFLRSKQVKLVFVN